MQCIGSSYEVRGSQTDKTEINLLTPQTAIASSNSSVAESNSNLPIISPLSVYLNLEDLKCFEVVDSQFSDYGITLQNAIAILPSNPAYPTSTGTTVLMGAPKNGWLEATFSQTIRKFCCYVTSSQATTISAYDHQDKLLARQSLSGANLAGFDSHLPPNAQLLIEEPNISRITLYAFDGQLTASDLSFDF
ncbi:MAG: hypothetical protein WBG73_14660 [Coleofasciculaceae cyanobacterium]